MTRLDKYLSDTVPCTRKEASKLTKGRRVTVNGTVEANPDTKLDEKTAVVALDGKELS